jgi:hypothetical protein
MKNRQVRQMQALQRTVELLHAGDVAKHLNDLPAAYHVQVEQLALAAQHVAKLGERQSDGTDAIAADGELGAQLREKVRADYLIPLARVCRPRFKSDPGKRHAFFVPHTNKKGGEVVAAAREMLKVLSGRVDLS